MRVSKVAFVLRFVLVGLCVFAATGFSCAPKPATSPAPAVFQVAELSINPNKVDPGEEVTIRAKVTNIGGTLASYTIELKINDVIEVAHQVDLAPGTSQRLRFSVYKDIPGTYMVTLDELTGNFVVLDTARPPPGPPTRIWILTEDEATDLLHRAIDNRWIHESSVHFLPDNKVEFRKNSDKLTTTASVSEGKLYLFGVRSEEWYWLKWQVSSYTSYYASGTKLFLTDLPPWFDPAEEIAPDVTGLPTFVSITIEEDRATEEGIAIIKYLRP